MKNINVTIIFINLSMSLKMLKYEYDFIYSEFKNMILKSFLIIVNFIGVFKIKLLIIEMFNSKIIICII